MNKFCFTNFIALLCICVMASGCSWLGLDDDPETAPIDTSDMIDIMAESNRLPIREEVLADLKLSEATPVEQWTQEGGGSVQPVPHLKGSTLTDVMEDTSIGDGHDWIMAAVSPSPVVNEQLVIAMDGHGVISAHQRGDITNRLWDTDALESDSNLLTGGLAIADDKLIAVTGHGKIAAFNLKDGKTLWSQQLDEPIRSSIRLGHDSFFIVTSYSKLLALSPYNGSVLWQHQGLHEDSGLFGTSLPTIYNEQLIIAYPSGELYRLDRRSGAVVWSDTLSRPRRTIATGLLNGVDASPATDGRLVYAGSASGLFVADDFRNGNRLWELPVGTSHSPWIEKDALYMVTEEGKLVAISIYRGQAGWAVPLLDTSKDATTLMRYHGPFLVNGTLYTLLANGVILRHDPKTGEKLGEEEVLDSLAASPAFAGDSAYLVTYGSRLIEVR